MHLALFEPDIPQNAGTLLRLGACLDVPVHIIEPAGFRLYDSALRRAGLDYLERAILIRHIDWTAFEEWRSKDGLRLILLTTKAEISYDSLTYRKDGILLWGQESKGAAAFVQAAADARVAIPMAAGMRSLNVAVAAAMVVGEALRQTRGFPAHGGALDTARHG